MNPFRNPYKNVSRFAKQVCKDHVKRCACGRLIGATKCQGKLVWPEKCEQCGRDLTMAFGKGSRATLPDSTGGDSSSPPGNVG